MSSLTASRRRARQAAGGSSARTPLWRAHPGTRRSHLPGPVRSRADQPRSGGREQAGAQRIAPHLDHSSIDRLARFLLHGQRGGGAGPGRGMRPAILFGRDGLLLNNIAWLLRCLPVFAVSGDGACRARPIHASDVARLCLRAASESADTVTDAVGPERPTFAELAG